MAGFKESALKLSRFEHTNAACLLMVKWVQSPSPALCRALVSTADFSESETTEGPDQLACAIASHQRSDVQRMQGCLPGPHSELEWKQTAPCLSPISYSCGPFLIQYTQ